VIIRNADAKLATAWNAACRRGFFPSTHLVNNTTHTGGPTNNTVPLSAKTRIGRVRSRAASVGTSIQYH
jgi:hypothetical protein